MSPSAPTVHWLKVLRKKVLLIVPKSSLRRYLPELFGDFSNLVVVNHTDLQRGSDWVEKLQRLKEQADVLVIDEAHHFRNPSTKKDTSRYWQMQALAAEQMVQKEQLKAQRKAATATKKRAASVSPTGATSLFYFDDDLDALAAAAGNSP